MAWVTKDSTETYNQTPEPPREYTKKEKAANWWHYHWMAVVVAVLVVVFGVWIIKDTVFQTRPDVQVAYVGTSDLPTDTVTALQDALTPFCSDLNGDGKTVVTLNVYTLDYSAGDTQTESDAYLTMAGTTKLATDVQGGLSSIFLLYDPAGFEDSTGTLRYLDGSLPQSDADNDWWNMVYHWDDCPVLAGLDLGDYTSDAVQNDSGSSQELLSHYYIGIRGAWTKDADDLLSGGEALWQALTAGAVSTVTKEG